jgi:hypothetical protein
VSLKRGGYSNEFQINAIPAYFQTCVRGVTHNNPVVDERERSVAAKLDSANAKPTN